MRKYILLLIIFSILEIGIALYLTTWREHFWNAISEKQSMQFLQQLGIFTVVACIAGGLSGISGYLVGLTAIEWRKKLNTKAFDITNCALKIENLNQRIQQDALDYPDLVLNLLFGTCKALLYIIVFVISFVISFSAYYLIIIMVYAIIGTLITKKIAYPLISLNYKQQAAEATYRNNLTVDNFSQCVALMFGIAKQSKYLTYFQSFYGQLGVVIPIIIIAPEFFGTAMTIGVLMRFNSVAGTIIDNMSYGISNFAAINKLLSCRKRLQEAQII